MSQTWELLNPVGVRMPPREASRDAAAGRRFVGFLSNRKPNATPLLQELAKRLPGLGFSARSYSKRNSATGAGANLLDRIGEECGLVVVASGD